MILYDEPQDVVAKAMRGLGMTASALAISSGVSESKIAAFLDGRTSKELALQIAPPLELCPDALAKLSDYRPRSIAPPGVTRVEVPFDDETVNIWLIESGDTVIVIDAGTRPNDLADLLAARGLDSVHLLITHEHRDHVGGIKAASGRLASLHARSGFQMEESAVWVEPGKFLELGSMTIEVFELRGHHPRAIGYRIEGPGLELLAVGDAIFAGSIGGCPDPKSFARARQTIEATLENGHHRHFLLTGHGAGTTLASELVSNPFLAGWMRTKA
ncbi:MBL fold metallo-hydrolase [Haloferula sp.]|uniref:MBL fold metallo-hydrolase n=1 Tax=Haloferula sp. TaxID=2497595 RepID=UPI0032A10C4B